MENDDEKVKNAWEGAGESVGRERAGYESCRPTKERSDKARAVIG